MSTPLNRQDRTAITQGMMGRTTFGVRFAVALADAAAQAHLVQIASASENLGPLFTFIEQLQPDYRQRLCVEVEAMTARANAHHRSTLKVAAPHLVEMLLRDDGTPERVLNCTVRTLKLQFPQSVWIPYYTPTAEIDDLLADDEGGAAAIAALDALAADYLSTENSLADYLICVRTVKQLSETMPEALAFIPGKARLTATIPDPSSALARLMRAGFETTSAAAVAA